MEDNLPATGMIPNAYYGVVDHQHHSEEKYQQWSSPFQYQGTEENRRLDANFTTGGQTEEMDHHVGLPFRFGSKGEHGKISVSDEEPSLAEEGIEFRTEGGKERKESPWHRMKWTDDMVKLLITAVSYVGEDPSSECNVGKRRKHAALQKKGKWKAISKVMAERGCFVSPQQCEDKFNDLNKRYKRITDILGRGTSCKVVENPALLDQMNHISEKLKEDVRKLLSSKHLYYEEMCSYHNCNRLKLPADPALQRSLHLALSCKDERDARHRSLEDIDEDDQSEYSDDDEADVKASIAYYGPEGMKLGVEHGNAGHGKQLSLQDSAMGLQAQGFSVDMNQLYSQGSDSKLLKQQLSAQSMELEEKRLHIEAQMVELERKQLKWQMFSKRKDRELDRMRMENERMKLENERMSLELRRRELELDHIFKGGQ